MSNQTKTELGRMCASGESRALSSASSHTRMRPALCVRKSKTMKTVTVQFTPAQLTRLQSAVAFLGRGVTLEKLIVSGALAHLDNWGTDRADARAVLRDEVAAYAKGATYAQPDCGTDLADGVQHEGYRKKAAMAA